jgi:hypothetical protein
MTFCPPDERILTECKGNRKAKFLVGITDAMARDADRIAIIVV